MSKCRMVHPGRTPAQCGRDAVEEHIVEGQVCCEYCALDQGHTPACNIRTYPTVAFAEYMGNPNAETDILKRLEMALNAVRIVQKEVTTINRLIWDLKMGHQHRTLQSLLHHLEIDLRYIDQEIKGIAG